MPRNNALVGKSQTLPVLTFRSFKPVTQGEVAGLLAKTAPAAGKGEYERYKTSHDFDGTYHNPQWLG